MAGPRKPWDDHRETALSVRWTNNYSLFEMLEVNRVVKNKEDNQHVTELADAISEHGFRQECPILVTPLPTGKLGILNGQHRFHACKVVGCEIGYLIVTKPFEEAIYDVMIDHSLTKAWRVLDFLSFYAKKGNPHYQVLTDFAASHGLTEQDAFYIFTCRGQKYMNNGSAMQHKDIMGRMKRGYLKFDADDQARALSTLEKIDRVRDFHPDYINFRKGSALIRALCDLVTHQDYDGDLMERQLEAQPSRLTRCGSAKDYLRLLEGIYNSRRKRQNHISLADDGPRIAAIN